MKHLIIAILMAGALLVPTESVAQSAPTCMLREDFVKGPVRSVLRVRPGEYHSSTIIMKGRAILVEEWSTEQRWVVTRTDATDWLCVLGGGSRA